MTSKVLYELLIRSYERFKYFSQTWNFTISKSTSVNQRKREHHGKIIFSFGKFQKMNDLSWRRKLRIVFEKKRILDPKISKKLTVQKWTHLQALNKELWAIYVFFTNLKFDDFQKHERKPTKMWTSWKNKFQPRKDPKNVTSDGHKWSLLLAQIVESFQMIISQKMRY